MGSYRDMSVSATRPIMVAALLLMEQNPAARHIMRLLVRYCVLAFSFHMSSRIRMLATGCTTEKKHLRIEGRKMSKPRLGLPPVIQGIDLTAVVDSSSAFAQSRIL